MGKKITIAIDGPAGAGKSTAAKRVAKELGVNYMDTGAMYRAVAYALLERGVTLSDREQVVKALEDICITVEYMEDGQHVLANGKDLTAFIRTPAVSMGASTVAVHKDVRDKLTVAQRETAERLGIVMDGRDIGTCVLKDAPLKFFITASSRIRAERRFAEMGEGDIDKIERDLIARDEQDSSRECAPLACAPDAIFLDTSSMTANEVAEFMISKAKDVLQMS